MMLLGWCTRWPAGVVHVEAALARVANLTLVSRCREADSRPDDGRPLVLVRALQCTVLQRRGHTDPLPSADGLPNLAEADPNRMNAPCHRWRSRAASGLRTRMSEPAEWRQLATASHCQAAANQIWERVPAAWPASSSSSSPDDRRLSALARPHRWWSAVDRLPTSSACL